MNPSKKSWPRYFLCASAISLTLALTACEEDVTAVLGTDLAYSLYGIFTPQLDTQWVRVYPIEGILEPTRPEPLNVRVTSTDVTLGETVVWRDSVIQERDGSFAHVFWAPFAARYGSTYRITVEGEDGNVSEAEATVPPRVEMVLGEPTIDRVPIIQPVHVIGGQPHLLKVEVVYHIKFALGPADRTERVISIDYNNQPFSSGSELMFNVNLSTDYRTIADIIRASDEYQPAFGIVLFNVNVRMIVADPDWNPPDGVFDRDVLVQPGIMNNVTNGFGFVGAGYRLQAEIVLPNEALLLAGFRLLDL